MQNGSKFPSSPPFTKGLSIKLVDKQYEVQEQASQTQKSTVTRVVTKICVKTWTKELDFKWKMNQNFLEISNSLMILERIAEIVIYKNDTNQVVLEQCQRSERRTIGLLQILHNCIHDP